MMRNMRQKRKVTTRDNLHAEKLRICRIEFLKLVLEIKNQIKKKKNHKDTTKNESLIVFFFMLDNLILDKAINSHNAMLSIPKQTPKKILYYYY